MPRYLELEVSLLGVEPRIWRRFLLDAESTFQDLHTAIQRACGWEDYHQFIFFQPASRRDQISITTSLREEPEELFGRRLPLARTLSLSSFFGKEGQSSCVYEYDFGDSWKHEVKFLQEIESPEVFRRKLVAGERAFPPEDSGGLPGYERCAQFVETGKDPSEEPENLREWIAEWDPERFDLAEVKRRFDL